MPPTKAQKDKEFVKERIRLLTHKLAEKRAVQQQRDKEIQALQRAKARTAQRMQKLRAWRRRRKRQLAKLNKPGQRRVVEEALKHVGKTESPAGSNKGPFPISACQEHVLGFAGVAWCGCFAGWLAETRAGVAAIGVRVAYCPYIDEDSRNAVNGFARQVPVVMAEPGDFCVFDWEHDGIEDHVGVVIKNLGNGWLEVCEGNTSFDYSGGSAAQSNGGCIALKKRDSSTIGCIARPAYK